MKKLHKLPIAVGLIAFTVSPFALAQNETPGLTPPSRSAGATIGSSASVSFDESQAVDAVENATFETKAQAIQEVESSLQENSSALNDVQMKLNQGGATPSPDARSALNDTLTARAEVRSKLSQLGAADEGTFDNARDALVDALSAYAEATAELDATIGEM